MSAIILEPNDLVFFRSGRPMGGSFSGQTIEWPTPDVMNHAIHAALHRSDLKNQAHHHRAGRSGKYGDDRNRVFGSVRTAGPFPVKEVSEGMDRDDNPDHFWYFQRPLDAQKETCFSVTHHPVFLEEGQHAMSSLPTPLKYPVANLSPPTKDSPEQWGATPIWDQYFKETNDEKSSEWLLQNNNDLSDIEHQYGIGIDKSTHTTGQGDAEGQFYSASYLRLKPHVGMGLLADAMDKVSGSKSEKRDLLDSLFQSDPTSILVGGQQRLCTARKLESEGSIPLPSNPHKASDFEKLKNGKYAVKWTLLTPAIFPVIESPVFHSGGWLPSWVQQSDGKVMLKCPDEKKRKPDEDRIGWRKRVSELESIQANLVAAVIGKSIPVTGWAVGDGETTRAGAKSTHLAVPAGSVYYFEAGSQKEALKLANALSWHGPTEGTSIINRRSTIFGEKGYGLGISSSWKFFRN